MRVLVLLFVVSLFHIPSTGLSENSTIEVVQTNPLILTLQKKQDLSFHLYNVEGGEVLHWQKNELGPGRGKPDGPWEEMEEGIYYLKIIGEEESAIVKLVIR